MLAHAHILLRAERDPSPPWQSMQLIYPVVRQDAVSSFHMAHVVWLDRKTERDREGELRWISYHIISWGWLLTSPLALYHFSSWSFQKQIIMDAFITCRSSLLWIYEVFVPALTFWVQRSSEMYKKTCLLEECQPCDVLLDNRHPHHLSSIFTSLM